MADTTRDWKDTILLPQTDFPMRANLAKREADLVARWEEEGLYHKMLEARADAPPYIFHDGPPYANGNIHHGHALNKILKDIVVKFRHLSGFRATNIPGWDCHGLPIEHKVDQELGKKKREMSVVDFRKECRVYADKWVGIQREEFKRLMVLAEWERPYKTMNFNYEATTLRQIGQFMEKGYVYNGLKPVHWSWAAVTALADAEVEYAAYTAPSVYVRFAFPEPPAWLAEKTGGRSVDAVIWTTTPWTLPSNLAIALGPELDYELLALNDSEAIILANGLKESVFEMCQLEDLEVLHTFKGEELVGRYGEETPLHETRHPFVDRSSVLVPADYVTLEQGTGLVHTAPGHGADDFDTGKKFDLGILVPVNQYGKYNAEVEGMGEFAAGLLNKHVFKANPVIAQHLEDTGRLLNKAGETYHVERYPHCWRTKKPLIFRATSQWFISVDHQDLRERSLREIAKTKWVPEWGENRIRAMMESRPDWCISRQRAWGVPIPAFECNSCGKQIVSHEVAYKVAELSESRGADVWFEEPAEALCPDGFTCDGCGATPDKFEKVKDILDVWFDSGVSWAAVVRDREGMGSVADLYLEGSDQHRGWFHTSLLAAVGTEDQAPYKTVLTHGFVVDREGHKYSKSSPNFEPLSKMLGVHGAEVLRLWVAMVDYRQDMALAPDLLKQASGAYRKIRNTMRFLMGSLADYDPAAHPLESAELSALDRWALSKTADFVDRMTVAYDTFEFHANFHTLFEFCNETLSSVYLDVLKDTLYCEAADSPSRRASQAVMYEALRRLVVVMAPILSFTADEVWGFMKHTDSDPSNVFLSDFPTTPEGWRDLKVEEEFEEKFSLRSRIKSLIEARRPKKRGEKLPGQLGSSQEAVVTMTVAAAAVETWRQAAAEIAELAIVASVEVVVGNPSDESGVDLAVEPSTHDKCPRCWNHRADIGSVEATPELCGRCATVIASQA